MQSALSLSTYDCFRMTCYLNNHLARIRRTVNIYHVTTSGKDHVWLLKNSEVHTNINNHTSRDAHELTVSTMFMASTNILTHVFINRSLTLRTVLHVEYYGLQTADHGQFA